MLVEYIRDINRVPFGVIVAIDRDSIGWSICHPKLDKFDKKLGLRIAEGRAKYYQRGNYPASAAIMDSGSCSIDITNSIIKMSNRAKKYFK